MSLDASSTHTFTFCSWNGCSSSLGGAITFREHTSSSLVVTGCIFCSCKCTSSNWVYGGAAIHCSNVKSVSIDSSTFLSCGCTYAVGGAICIIGISAVPEITENDFITCSGGEDGGGIWLSGVTATNGVNRPVRDCRFIHCTANGIMYNNNNNDGDGGALVLGDNTHPLGVSDSLFLSNHASTDGGALFIQLSTYVTQHRVVFCFFHKNTAPLGCDALIDFTYAGNHQYDKVFLQSFTTCTLKSLAESNASPTTIDNSDNWLPQTHTNLKLYGTSISTTNNISTHINI